MTEKAPTGFNIELIPGRDFDSLEQAQRSLFPSLPQLIAEAVRRGLETGAFKIIDNKIVLCDTMEGQDTR